MHWGYNNPRYPANTRYYAEGQHFYEFKRENGEWKISSMRGRPTFEKTEPFDPVFLRALFDYAQAKARAGYPWKPTLPP